MEKAQDDDERVGQPTKGIESGIGMPGTHARFTCKRKILNQDVQDNAGKKDCNLKGKASSREELSGRDIEKVWLTITL